MRKPIPKSVRKLVSQSMTDIVRTVAAKFRKRDSMSITCIA